VEIKNMVRGKFATAVTCMDGRVQLPVIEWLKEQCGVDYVDVITEPGPNRILAENNELSTVESIKRRVGISVEKHDSKIVAIIGHYDCAGNPVGEGGQMEQINSSVDLINTWGYGVRVIGLWVDEKWKVNEIK
jgi:carbonic anhydrase